MSLWWLWTIATIYPRLVCDDNKLFYFGWRTAAFGHCKMVVRDDRKPLISTVHCSVSSLTVSPHSVVSCKTNIFAQGALRNDTPQPSVEPFYSAVKRWATLLHCNASRIANMRQIIHSASAASSQTFLRVEIESRCAEYVESTEHLCQRARVFDLTQLKSEKEISAPSVDDYLYAIKRDLTVHHPLHTLSKDWH